MEHEKRKGGSFFFGGGWFLPTGQRVQDTPVSVSEHKVEGSCQMIKIDPKHTSEIKYTELPTAEGVQCTDTHPNLSWPEQRLLSRVQLTLSTPWMFPIHQQVSNEACSATVNCFSWPHWVSHTWSHKYNWKGTFLVGICTHSPTHGKVKIPLRPIYDKLRVCVCLSVRLSACVCVLLFTAPAGILLDRRFLEETESPSLIIRGHYRIKVLSFTFAVLYITTMNKLSPSSGVVSCEARKAFQLL